MSEPISAEGRVPPLLIIVSGALASGKTTLAKRLACELGLVRLCKDELREIMGDLIPPKTYLESKALGGAAYALCYRLAAETLAVGVGVVLDAAFSRGLAEPALAPIAAQARTVLVHLSASSQLSSDRFHARFERGERHPAHMDALGAAIPGDLWKDVWAELLHLSHRTATCHMICGPGALVTSVTRDKLRSSAEKRRNFANELGEHTSSARYGMELEHWRIEMYNPAKHS